MRRLSTGWWGGLALLPLSLALSAPLSAQWGEPAPPTTEEKMQRAIELYEQGQDDESMDLFMDVLVKGDPSEKALANDYLNRITRRMSAGEQHLPPAPVAGGTNILPANPTPSALMGKPEAPAPAAPFAAQGPSGLRAEAARANLMRSEIQAKIEAMRNKVMERLKADKTIRILQEGELPDGFGLPSKALFASDVLFKLPSADQLLGRLADLLYTLADAQVYVLPEGYVLNTSRVLDMRRAMAVRSYLVARDISPARIRVALVGNEVSVPTGLADYPGVSLVIQYGKQPRLNIEGPVDDQMGPPLSLGVWPPKLDPAKGEGVIIEFSAMEPPQGLASWRFEMTMPTVEGSDIISSLEQVVGDGPVLHQIYWNGRRNYFGDILPRGRYEAVLKAKNLRGKETVLRREIVLGSLVAPPPPPTKLKKVQVATIRRISRKLRASKKELPAKVVARAPTPKPAAAEEAAPAAAALQAAPAAAALPAAPIVSPEAAAPKAEPPKEPIAVGGVVNFEVYFARDSTTMMNEKVLQRVPANLTHYPLANLNLVGYAYKGERDPASLAEKRMRVVAELLVQKYNVDKSKILTQSQVVDDENTSVEIYISQSPVNAP